MAGLRNLHIRVMLAVSKAAFALVFLHAVLSGTDFSDPAISAITWGATASLAILALARALWGRLPA